MNKLATSLFLLLPTFACDPGGTGDGTNGGGTTTDDTTSAGDDATTSAGDDTGSATNSGTSPDPDDSGSDDATTGALPGTACDAATLRMGNPYYQGDLGGWQPGGQGVLDDPPLRSRHLATVGGQLIVETQSEVWVADDATVHRIAGDEDEFDWQYQPAGPCTDVRLLIGAGVAALPDGNIVVADSRGNGLIEFDDPLGACTASPIAGNPDAILDVDITEDAAAVGDVDGPGAQARFYGVSRPVADADGNVFVIDAGNTKIKRVAPDAGRTVATVYDFGADDLVLAMTVLDGTLYVTGTTSVDDFVWAIDPATGMRQELFLGRGLFEEVGPTQQASMFALVHDGVDLLVASNKGWIFRMSTDAEPLGVVAGIGPIVDFPSDLDLSGPIPTESLPLRGYAINDAGMVRAGNDILSANSDGAVGFHVWSIHCE